MTISIKNYSNIDELRRDLGKINKAIKNSLEINSAIINLRTSGMKNPLKSSKPGELKLKDPKLNKIQSLTNQQTVIQNMQNAVMTDLKNQIDPATQSKINALLKKISNNIKAKLEKEYEINRNATSDAASDEFVSIVTKIRKALEKTLAGKFEDSELSMLSGVDKDGSNMIAAYIEINKLKNDRGQIDPKLVIAVTNKGTSCYINPSLHRIEFPGQFNKGMQFTKVADAFKIIENQLLVDSNMNIIAPQPVPFTKAQLNLAHSKIKKVLINTNNISIDIDAKSRDEAQSLANEFYKEIYSTLLKIDPKNRSKILYQVGKKGITWRAVYTFISGARGKQISRNLKKEEISHLSKIFNDEEIQKVRKALSEG